MFLRNKAALLAIILLLFAANNFAQVRIEEIAGKNSPKLNRERGMNMLDEMKDLLKMHYYDKNYRGIDIDKRFKAAKEQIKTLNHNSEIFSVIAQIFIEFDDSHTMFYPPNRSNRTEYGFSMQMIGHNCVITDVKPKSDAEAKGLKVGDVVAAIGKYAPTRDSLWKLKYLLYWLNPQESLQIYVLNPDKTEKELIIKAKVITFEERKKQRDKRRQEKQENPYKCRKISAETIACRLETFSVEKKYIDRMMKEVAGHKKMILDLRGNSGGLVKIEEYLTGHFFDRKVKIADFVTRDKTEERIAKPQKENAFSGELLVLLDSQSASASEVFARVIQLEKRGKVVGDVSAGAVMTSFSFTGVNSRGMNEFQTFSFYGMNLTVADLIMSDGKRLEKIGVIPDHPVGPTGHALFHKSDPVFAYAAGLLNTKLTPEEAGTFNFLTKPVEDDEEETSDQEEK